MTRRKELNVEIRGPRPPLGIEIDRTGTALYVLITNADVARTVEIEPGLLADHDDQGGLVGFEVIGLEKGRVGKIFGRLRREFADQAPGLEHLAALCA